MAKQATAAGGNTEAAAAVSVAEHVAEGQKGPFSTLLDDVPWYDLAAGRYISAAENPGGTPAGANEAGAK